MTHNTSTHTHRLSSFGSLFSHHTHIKCFFNTNTQKQSDGLMRRRSPGKAKTGKRAETAAGEGEDWEEGEEERLWGRTTPAAEEDDERERRRARARRGRVVLSAEEKAERERVQREADEAALQRFVAEQRRKFAEIDRVELACVDAADVPPPPPPAAPPTVPVRVPTTPVRARPPPPGTRGTTTTSSAPRNSLAGVSPIRAPGHGRGGGNGVLDVDADVDDLL